jgi:FlaA1/EpsC-like NDP-sugar epimerase
VFLPKGNTPRWIIFIIDVAICLFAFTLAYLIRFEFAPPSIEIDLAVRFMPLLLGVRITCFLLGKTYAGIIRFTSSQDTQRIFIWTSIGSAVFALLNVLRFKFYDGIYFIPYSIIILEYLLSLFSMIVSRIAVKVLYLELKTPDKARKRVVIYGAGESGMLTKQAIDKDPRAEILVIGFIDDDERKSGKKLGGVDIYHSNKTEELFASGKVDDVIIAIPSLGKKKKAEFIEIALNHHVKVSNVPPIKQWIGGQFSVKQIRDIKIEDLLGRESIKLNSTSVSEQVKDQVVLVSGAAGSIGSELIRQLLSYDPKLIIALDQAETPVFQLDNELRLSGYSGKFEIVMGDVRQHDRMKKMMEHFRPTIVYHAAAYKHVPLMENNPSEAVLANVLGTKTMADLAEEYGVEKFVFISTDKAVNPTSVMGATKRAAEIYIQSKNQTSNTKFVTTRFGNVLGSNGSVIPIFKKQIEEGGPITVTHPDVTRFFMTIPEAVQLVLEAGAMSAGGEIFAFDMGESVKVRDLAYNMIKLSGMEPGKDIEIVYTGLRPGEKLYEEVLSDAENTMPTHNPKILKAKVREYSFDKVTGDIQELITLFDKQDNQLIVKKLKQIIPEYISNNSDFSALDR